MTSLHSLVGGIVRTLDNARVGTAFRVVTAEIDIPFSGTVSYNSERNDVLAFEDVVVLSDRIPRQRANRWRLRVRFDQGRVAVRVDRDEAATVS